MYTCGSTKENAMTDEITTKAWYLSRGMWAGILTSILGIYASLQTQLHLPDITTYLPIAFMLLGLLGVYGRLNADGKIIFTDQKSN